MRRNCGRYVDSIIQEMLVLKEVSVFGGSRTALALDGKRTVITCSNTQPSAKTLINISRKYWVQLAFYHC